MKYYCENCGSELNLRHDWLNAITAFCPVCEDDRQLLHEIPAHETVAQWEKRTGKQYLDTAPTYARFVGPGMKGLTGWLLCMYDFAVNSTSIHQIIVATEAGAPPDDWRPE